MLKRKTPTGEPKPQGRSQKIMITEAIITIADLRAKQEVKTEQGEVAMLLAKAISKIYEPKIFDKAVNN